MMQTSPAAGALLQRLRNETRDEHLAVERAIDLLSPALTRAGYRSLLERFRGFHAPLEEQLQVFAQWPELGIALGARSRIARLDADLRDLGCEQPERLPRASDLPVLETIDEALGCAYVFEGATRGAPLISRHVEKVLGVTPIHAGRFFAGNGSQAGAMWRVFRDALSAHAEAGGDADRIIAGARQTFRTFRRWITAGEALG